MSEHEPSPPAPLTATISLDADLSHPVSRVWSAIAETAKRISWGVPDGAAMIYEHDDFRTGGSFRARCGTPGELEFAAFGYYSAIEPERYVVSTETVRRDETVLTAALITWKFESIPTGTRVRVIDQVASFVGQGMIDGHRNGHDVCLRQLGSFLSR